MKLLIHGRKNGYTVLYPRPTPTEFYSFASDIQSISANNYDVYYGKNFYTLAFVDGGCVFTKYVIGDDIERGQLGEIGISVFIPNTYELSGEDVKTLLDELINIYSRNYISNNKIEEPKNGFDWVKFTSLANGYDAKLLSRTTSNDNITTGTQDPAFHYYKSDSELIEHLDKPFQEEYSDYRQILFIDSNFKGAANPLNVIKNSGIEVNPDLKNEYCYLNNYNKSRGVKITAYYNNKWNECSDGKGNNQIREKWQVEIKYSKDYFKPIEATGSISNRASDIYKYLEINGSSIKIKYDAFLPEPETKTFTFDVTKKDGTKVSDAEIHVDIQPWQHRSNVTFIAEELGREHKIAARKGVNLFSDVVKITPKDYSSTSIPLPLIEKRVVKITAKDQENGDDIWQFKVHITGTNFYKVTDQIEFVGDEIDEEWNIQIEKRNEYSVSENKKFCPARDGNEINFKLKKNQDSPRELSNTGHNDPYSHNKHERQKSFASKAKTFFSKPAVIATSIASALVLGIGIGALCYFSDKCKQPVKNTLNKWYIESYVEDDSLFLGTLNDYKENWKKQEQDFITKSGRGIFGGNENVDSTKWKSDWKPTDESIDRAIKKRKLINDKNIAELRKQRYSAWQLSFKTVIENIDSTKYREVSNQLGDVSALTLTQIAKKINEILKQKEPAKEETQQEPKREESKPAQKKETSKKNEQAKEKLNQEQKPAASDKISEIIQYIKGSELDKAKLNEYKKTKDISPILKNSIQICLEFWALDGLGSGKTSKTYWEFRNKVNADNNFNSSKLKAFIDKMCEPGASPSYSEIDKKKGIK